MRLYPFRLNETGGCDVTKMELSNKNSNLTTLKEDTMEIRLKGLVANFNSKTIGRK
jgi:hypothetical protein